MFKFPKFIEDFLNGTTMYRLVLYYLTALILIAVLLSAIGVLRYNPLHILFLAAILTIVCWGFNEIFAWVYKAPVNVESSYVTAFILTLIIAPKSPADLSYVVPVVLIGIVAIASKYILVVGKKHLFNPAAFAVAFSSFALGLTASWWVGTAYMDIAVLLGGILLIHKLRRWDLVLSFFVAALVSVIAFGLARGADPLSVARRAIVDSSLLFLGFVMLTEPQTTPPTRGLQIWYGVLVGALFAPQVHIGPFYSTPELTLLVGNIFSYLVSPKQKLILKFKEKVQLAPSVYDFVFESDKKMNFVPGQYLEWTLSHDSPDARGNRRFFTIASSPTEPEIIAGLKFYEHPSTFKQKLLTLAPGSKIAAGQLSGDFTLPKDPAQKLAFIAGGIGITPFRSMVKYLLDTREQRQIVLFYANRSPQDVVYKDIFDRAAGEIGLKTIYTANEVPAGVSWEGETGVITRELIAREAPDFAQRTFYISGPPSMVDAFKKTLLEMGVHRTHIKTDFFQGYA